MADLGIAFLWGQKRDYMVWDMGRVCKMERIYYSTVV
jgi:hypothetical protein